MQQVSSHFLEQTLDKKLMSDLRVCKLLMLEFVSTVCRALKPHNRCGNAELVCLACPCLRAAES